MAKAAKTDAAAPVRYWLKEIDAARKREKDYRKDGERIRAIYAGEKADQIPYNILFANTEVILPALYSAVPRPVVQRRYKDDDALGKAAAQASQRVLEFLLDTNIDGYETFDEGLTWVTLDALLPGRGVSTVKYDADIGYAGTDPAEKEEEQTEGAPAADSAPTEPTTGGTPAPAAPTPVKKSELVCTDAKSWNRVYFGFARKWSKMPWVAYEEHIDKDEATRLFGAPIAGKIQYTKGEESEDDKKKDADEDQGERKTACIYQIWDKDGGRKIRYVSPAYKDGYLKVADDPLQLTGFFNCPKPLTLIEKTDDLTPTSLYSLYENQAKELNTLTVRINRLVAAIRARALYDGSLGGDLDDLLDKADGMMVPTEKASSLAANGGLEKAIWFLPVDVLAKVLQELYAARENCKQVIYEIMGIADILRGASNPNETLGAQEIKTRFGSLRLKPKQGEVQRYARDLLRMMLEVAATKFSQDTWSKMTGLPFLTDMQAMQAQQIAQAAAQAGNPGPLQQLQQQTTWAQVLGTLKDDIQRAYKVDIETNSTVEPEAVEDQKNIGDFLTAMGEFLQGVAPLIQSGAMPFEVAQTMLLTLARRFRFGSEIEDQIKAMKQPAPPDNGEAQKAQQAVQQSQAQVADITQKSQATELQHRAQIADLQTKLQTSESGKQLDARKSDLDVRELSLNTERELFEIQKKQATSEHQSKVEGENTKLDFKKQLTGLEVKGAKAEASAAKESADVSKVVDSKVGDGVRALQDRLAEHSEQLQELHKAVKAPRIRRVKSRDKDGKIAEVIDEVAA